jgi:hypothetical protein
VIAATIFVIRVDLRPPPYLDKTSPRKRVRRRFIQLFAIQATDDPEARLCGAFRGGRDSDETTDSYSRSDGDSRRGRRAMHLVLGDARDPLSSGVRDALIAGGVPTRFVADPLRDPIRFTWRLETSASASSLVLEDGLRLESNQVSGVFVGAVGAIDPVGWDIADLTYVRSEAHAALLAWLWSLDCPVVNRPRASTWYRPKQPLLAWYSRLVRSGLPAMDTLLTNVADEARRFARGSSTDVNAAVFGPLTSDARYLVADERDWEGLLSLQRLTPVPLAHPHGAPTFACVVGDRVVWEPANTPATAQYEPELRVFAAGSGLELVEVVFAPVDGELFVIGVDPQPDFNHFGGAARALIVENVVDLLTRAGPHTAPSIAEAIA